MRRCQAPSQKSNVLQGIRPNGGQSPIEDEPVRLFQVLYGKISTKTKQKTYEFDGTLKLDNGILSLLDDEGYRVCSTPILPEMRLRVDSQIVMEPNELMIIREVGGKEEETRREMEMRREDPETPVTCPFQPPVMEVFVKHECPSPETTLRQMKEEEQHQRPSSNRRESVEVEDLRREELILCCRPSKRQVVTLQCTYKDIEELGDDDDPIDLLNELREICNTVDDSNGKIEVLRSLTSESLSRNETVWITAETDKVLNDLYDYGARNFPGNCEIFQNNGISERKSTSRAIFAPVSLLDAMLERGVVVHRTIIFENLSAEEEVEEKVRRITKGPVYSLLICGSIEERLLQLKHNLLPEDNLGMKMLGMPGDFSGSNTHKLMKCTCLDDDLVAEDDDEVPAFQRKKAKLDVEHPSEGSLKEWQHIPGRDFRKHLQKLNISQDCDSSVAFIYKRSSYSSFSK